MKTDTSINHLKEITDDDLVLCGQAQEIIRNALLNVHALWIRSQTEALGDALEDARKQLEEDILGSLSQAKKRLNDDTDRLLYDEIPEKYCA